VWNGHERAVAFSFTCYCSNEGVTHSFHLHTHWTPLRPPLPATPARFSWNKSQLEKARNEGGTQTNPLATAMRGVLTGVPTAVLVVASITRLSDTSYNK